MISCKTFIDIHFGLTHYILIPLMQTNAPRIRLLLWLALAGTLLFAVIYAVGDAAYKVHLAKQSPRTQSNTPMTPLAQESHYVAMGDSYSAGGGADRTPTKPAIDISAYDTSTKCYRSKYAAQYLLARSLDLKLTDASCGGAITENLITTNQENMPPQITRLTSDTKLVTMTIGGNDTALLYALNCIQTSDCSNNPLVTTLINLRIAGLPTNLEAIYKAVIEKAPNAKIRHAGYPHIIAPPGASTGTCASWLSASEQKVFDELLTGTNNKIKQTIEKFANDTGTDARYVDPLVADSPFMQLNAGQTLDGCSTSNKRYMNGPNDGTEGGWHPNIYGQRSYAELYEKSLK